MMIGIKAKVTFTENIQRGADDFKPSVNEAVRAPSFLLTLKEQ